MMIEISRRTLASVALCGSLGASVAGCDRLLVDPASGPTTSIALALSPSGPDFAVAPASANGVRVQVVDDGGILLDTTLVFDPELEELLVPVRFSERQRSVAIFVEIGEDGRPLLRGSTEVLLQQRRVTDAEVSLAGAELTPLGPSFDLTAGVYHSCAAAGEGALYCWGNNDDGQLGSGKFTPSSLAAFVESSRSFYSISAGFLTTCGLANEGEAYCWGDNEFGSLGVGSSQARSAVPVAVSTEEGFSMLTVGGLHACGLTFGGEAFCWGFNGFGQLGDGTTTNQFTPIPVNAEIRFESISAGYLHTCAISTQGQTHCWGLNDFGQLGDGTETDSSLPVLVGGQQRFSAITAGGLHTCALGFEGEASCWGFNDFGQLGNGSNESSNIPQPVEGGSFEQLSAGGLHTCAVGTDTDAFCWGYNGSGALGDDTLEDSATPVLVTGGHSFELVRAGLHHSCGTADEGQVVCWGYNRFGQLGDGSRFNRPEPGDVLYGDPFFQEERIADNEQDDALAALLQGRLVP